MKITRRDAILGAAAAAIAPAANATVRVIDGDNLMQVKPDMSISYVGKVFPIRLSVDEMDAGWHEDALRMPIQITVNGQIAIGVYTADERKGYVIVSEGDGRDRKRVIVRGVVSIEGMDRRVREAHYETLAHRLEGVPGS